MQCGPFRVVSLMSSEAVDELGLEPGSVAVAVIKSTNVIIETPRGRMKRLIAPSLALLLHSPPCGSDGPGAADGADAARQVTITVFAAASLEGHVHRDRRAVRGRARRRHRDASTSPARRISSPRSSRARPADVFASADTKNMDKATADDLRRRVRRPTSRPTRSRSRRLRTTRPRSTRSTISPSPAIKVVVCAAAGAVRRGAQRGSRRRRASTSSRSARSSRSPTCSARSSPARPMPAWSTSPTSKAAGDKVDGVDVPGVGRRRQHLPDRGAVERRHAGDVAEAFIELRHRTEGPGGARRGRLRQALMQ